MMTWPVFSEVKTPVEKLEITTAHSRTGHHRASHFKFGGYSSR